MGEQFSDVYLAFAFPAWPYPSHTHR
ncbi:hypothetical protein CBM2599_B50324 [Cupriavidus taiwanensis]|nr:hypothetical protein CBM2600_B10670 [Cupriavidus taiwanensis]SOY96392.1 hypothetical protein CBM2599_B50324 [Cupriavidus taiwanensis]